MKEVRPKSVGSRQVGGEGRTVRDPGPYTITRPLFKKITFTKRVILKNKNTLYLYINNL